MVSAEFYRQLYLMTQKRIAHLEEKLLKMDFNSKETKNMQITRDNLQLNKNLNEMSGHYLNSRGGSACH